MNLQIIIYLLKPLAHRRFGSALFDLFSSSGSKAIALLNHLSTSTPREFCLK